MILATPGKDLKPLKAGHGGTLRRPVEVSWLSKRGPSKSHPQSQGLLRAFKAHQELLRGIKALL